MTQSLPEWTVWTNWPEGDLTRIITVQRSSRCLDTKDQLINKKLTPPRPVTRYRYMSPIQGAREQICSFFSNFSPHGGPNGPAGVKTVTVFFGGKSSRADKAVCR
jgi:hypothetical protein